MHPFIKTCEAKVDEWIREGVKRESVPQAYERLDMRKRTRNPSIVTQLVVPIL